MKHLTLPLSPSLLVLITLLAACSTANRSPSQSSTVGGMDDGGAGDDAARGGSSGGGGGPSDGGGEEGGGGPSESPSCTTLTSTAGSILDGAGDVWTLVPGSDGSLVVDENGAPAGFSDQIVELAYVNHVVSQENVGGAWWSWQNGAWSAEGDPTTACGDPGAADGGVFTAGRGEQARMADAFVDSIGANTHFTYGDTNWGNDRDSIIVPGLAKLGIRHVRDALDLSDANAYSIYADVYGAVKKATGVTLSFDLVMPYPAQYGGCNPGSIDLGHLLASMPPQNIDSFEGINEWNGFSQNAGLACSGHVWQADLRSSQPALYAAVKGRSQLSGIKVLGPALALWSFGQLQSDAASVGDLSASMDYGAEHSYCGGQMPSTNIAQYHASVASMDGNRPFTVTESGYYTMPDGQQGISETAHGKYMSRFFLEYFNAGSARTYVYDLVDDTSAGATSEGNFGLMRGDGSFKPGATATQNEIALLGDPGPAFTPGQLDYSLGSAPPQVHHTLLQKRNGTMYLVLWQEVNSYDTAKQTDLSVAAVSVDVDLGQTFSKVNQYAPVASSAPKSSSSNAQKLTVAVPDEALILEIVP